MASTHERRRQAHTGEDGKHTRAKTASTDERRWKEQRERKKNLKRLNPILPWPTVPRGRYSKKQVDEFLTQRNHTPIIYPQPTGGLHDFSETHRGVFAFILHVCSLYGTLPIAIKQAFPYQRDTRRIQSWLHVILCMA